MSDESVRVTALGRSVFRIERADGTHVLAYAAVEGEKTWVFIDGVTSVVEPSRRSRSAATHDVLALAAPMPATVTQIHVAPGQTVTKGDVLMTLEAMKMELPIRATTDGTVTAINCQLGELVQAGVALIELREPEPEPELEPELELEPEPELEHEPRSEKGEA